jgi:hypothetical protein
MILGSETFDEAICAVAIDYADQVSEGYGKFTNAVLGCVEAIV